MSNFLEMKGNDMTIRVPAELDHHSAEHIRREADRILQNRKVSRIFFDFRDTVFMDSAGIGMILGRYKALQLVGGKVYAVHVKERVRRILMLSGVHKIIEIYEDMPEFAKAGQGRNEHGL